MRTTCYKAAGRHSAPWCELYGDAGYDSERRTSTNMIEVTCRPCLRAVVSRVTRRLDGLA